MTTDILYPDCRQYMGWYYCVKDHRHTLSWLQAVYGLTLLCQGPQIYSILTAGSIWADITVSRTTDILYPDCRQYMGWHYCAKDHWHTLSWLQAEYGLTLLCQGPQTYSILTAGSIWADIVVSMTTDILYPDCRQYMGWHYCVQGTRHTLAWLQAVYGLTLLCQGPQTYSSLTAGSIWADIIVSRTTDILYPACRQYMGWHYGRELLGLLYNGCLYLYYTQDIVGWNYFYIGLFPLYCTHCKW